MRQNKSTQAKYARTLVAACFALLACASVFGQATKPMDHAAHPVFDVATIKLTDPASHRQGIGFEGTHTTLRGQTLVSMMMFAFGLHKTQIVNAPDWASTERYEIDGIADKEGEPDLPQMQEMLRKLLVDRFALASHPDQREMTYYAITVNKGGPKITRSATDDDINLDQTGNGNGKLMEMKFTSNLMSDFALGMQYFLDKPAINETGLPGRYDFTLKWTPSDAQMTDPDAPAGIYTAFREQLGLKLEPKHGPVPVVVIDHVARPSSN